MILHENEIPFAMTATSGVQIATAELERCTVIARQWPDKRTASAMQSAIAEQVRRQTGRAA